MAQPSDSEIVANLAEEFIELHRQGKRPRIDDYVQDYSHLAEEIRNLFPTLLVVEDLALDQNASLDGGIQATGNYPGKARNADEVRADLDMAYSMLPGKHRLNLHALYAETGGAKVERDEAFARTPIGAPR